MTRADFKVDLSPTQIHEQIEKFLSETRVLTLSTAVNNTPWSCTLAFAYDDGLNLYCITNKDTRHVREINENPNVSVALHEHQSPNYNPRTVKGLQVEGRAEILSGSAVVSGLGVFIGRFPLAEAMSRERLFELKTARIIKIRLAKLFYLDRGNIGPRVEYDLT